MPVTVRDLEVAQVLAREVKAAAARSAGASLRADQLKLLFGAAELDAAERERIQAALEMVGLDPQPSLLEVDGDAPVAFVARPAGAFPPERKRRFSGGEERQARPDPGRAATERGEFPTVGEFARSTFERARRRLSERDDGGEAPAETNGATAHATEHLDFDYVPPAAAPAPDRGGSDVNGSAHAPETERSPHSNGSAPEAEEAEAALPVEAAASAETGADELAEFEEPGGADQTGSGAVEAAEPEHEEPGAAGTETGAGELAEFEEPGGADQTGSGAVEVAVPAAEAPFPAELETGPGVAGPEPEQPALTETEAPVAGQHEVRPAAAEEEPPEPEPLAAPPARGPALRTEIAVAIVTAAILPVIGTSIAGWRFGLPYLAVAVAATGWLVAKDRTEGNSAVGVVGAVRTSPLAGGALRITALLTVVSVVAAVLLASASTSRPAPEHATPAALGDWMLPVASNARRIRATAHRHRLRHHRPAAKPAPQPAPAANPTPTTTTPAPTTTAPATQDPTAPSAPPTSQNPPAGPGTQGLYEVPAGR